MLKIQTHYTYSTLYAFILHSLYSLALLFVLLELSKAVSVASRVGIWWGLVILFSLTITDYIGIYSRARWRALLWGTSTSKSRRRKWRCCRLTRSWGQVESRVCPALARIPHDLELNSGASTSPASRSTRISRKFCPKRGACRRWRHMFARNSKRLWLVSLQDFCTSFIQLTHKILWELWCHCHLWTRKIFSYPWLTPRTEKYRPCPRQKRFTMYYS